MNIVFRVDSSNEMGAGHLMRCLTLANNLREHGCNVIFICRDLSGNYIYILQKQNFTVHILPSPVSDEGLCEQLNEHKRWLGVTSGADSEQIVDILRSIDSVELLIVDHYGLDHIWEIACRPYVDHIMVIDDLADREHDCDILLDQNYAIDPLDRYNDLLPLTCSKLLGPRFALLRPEFSEARRNLRLRDGDIKRVLVFNGSSDNENITAMVLQGIIASKAYGLHVDVVVGSNNRNVDNIRQICNESKMFNYHQQTENIAELMMNADLAFGSGGVATWERCCVGLPSIIINSANNQNVLTKNVIPANIFKYLGDIKSLTVDDIVQVTNYYFDHKDMLCTMSMNAINMVDGMGCKRVANEIFRVIGHDKYIT